MSKTVIQFNCHDDVDTESRSIVEVASDQPLEELQMDDINSFLNGLYLFHKEADEVEWTN